MENALTLFCIVGAVWAFLPRRRRHHEYPSRVTSRPLRLAGPTKRPPTIPLLAALIGRSIATWRATIAESWRAFVGAYDAAMLARLNNTMSRPALPVPADDEPEPLVLSARTAEPQPEPAAEPAEYKLTDRRKAVIRELLKEQIPARKIAILMPVAYKRALTIINEIAHEEPVEQAEEDASDE